MPPKKVTKDHLLGLLKEYAGEGGVPVVGTDALVVPLRASELVTYPALSGVLASLEERHNGLVSLLEVKFHGLEEMSRDRANQITKAEAALNSKISDEVARNDKRYRWVTSGVVGVLILEVIRFFISKG